MLVIDINSSIIKQFKNFPKDKVQEVINNCKSWKDFIEYLGLDYKNARHKLSKFREACKSLGLNYSHFTRDGKKPLKDYSNEEIISIIKNCKNWKEIEDKFGFRNVACMRNFKERGIDYSFVPSISLKHKKSYKDFTDGDLENFVKTSKGWSELYNKVNIYKSEDKKALKDRIKNLQLDISHFPISLPNIPSDEELAFIVKNSFSFVEVSNKVGYSELYLPLKRRIENLNLNVSHFHSKNKEYFKKPDLEKLKSQIKISDNWVDLCRNLGYTKFHTPIINEVIKNNIDYSHFKEIEIDKFSSLSKDHISKALNQFTTWQDICDFLKIPLKEEENLRCFLIHNNFNISNINNNITDFNLRCLEELSSSCKSNLELQRKVLAMGFNLKKSKLNEFLNSFNLSGNFKFKRKFEDINFSKDELENAIKESFSWKEVSLKLGYPEETWITKVRYLADKYNLNYSHFNYLNHKTLEDCSEDEIITAVKNSSNLEDVANYLGIKLSTSGPEISNTIKNLGIDCSHFKRSGDIILGTLKKSNISKEELQSIVDSQGSFRGVCKAFGFKESTNSLKVFLEEKGIQIPEIKKLIRYNDSIINELLGDLYKDNKITLAESFRGHVNEIHLFKCSKHGVFKRTVSNILQGSGCPECRETRSIGEHSIRSFLISQGLNPEIDFIEQKRFEECKSLRTLPFDFYIPFENTCIEFQGSQHYIPVNYGGISDEEACKQLKYTQNNDAIKKEFCKLNNITLIEISSIKEIPIKLDNLIKDFNKNHQNKTLTI